RVLADDSVHIGRLHHAGERVGFWAIAPVYARGERLGYVAQPRTVGGLRNAVTSLRGLVGEQVTLYLRNRDGSVWVSAPGQPARAPRRADTTDHGVIITRDDGARSFAEQAWIDGTPWSAVMETPTSAVLARPREAVAWLAVLSLLLTVAGGIVAWVVSRRITKPLAELTAAAEAVAQGTYEHPVVAGHDEIGRLATSFDEMARQVDAARRELEQRADDAQRARNDAERANRAKSDFLAMMSHELRTPLNAIGGYTELLRMGIHGPITDAQRDALVRISRSQAHLLTLINDVLNFARVDAGQVQFEIRDVPVQETLASLEALIAPQVRTRGIRFEVQPCDPALTARADRDKLGQVVLNLLGNAIKFTPEGGTVQLTCEADADYVRVHVRDTGSGIAPDRLDEIFEPFVQAHRALNRPSEGVGLGLAISRDLARGMGGEITVSSVLGLGSTFSLALQRGPDRVALGEPGRTSRDTPESAPVA
ncbi:MAG TPA: ATP-binding protein, partial [Gemmatimonadaceae bacterium]|nr:ATP-binding protein [Gemmatimonadaceae bacterium]